MRKIKLILVFTAILVAALLLVSCGSKKGKTEDTSSPDYPERPVDSNAESYVEPGEDIGGDPGNTPGGDTPGGDTPGGDTPGDTTPSETQSGEQSSASTEEPESGDEDDKPTVPSKPIGGGTTQPETTAPETTAPETTAPDPGPQSGGSVSLTYSNQVSISKTEEKITKMFFANPSRSTNDISIALYIGNVKVAQSGILEPGNQLPKIELDKPALQSAVEAAGTYDGKFIVEFYNATTNEKAAVNTEIPLTITVT